MTISVTEKFPANMDTNKTLSMYSQAKLFMAYEYCYSDRKIEFKHCFIIQLIVYGRILHCNASQHRSYTNKLNQVTKIKTYIADCNADF